MMSAAPKFLNSIALLRVLAVTLVFYCHLIGSFAERENVVWMPHMLISSFIIQPLNLMKDSAEIGVAIFFLVSGYIIPYVARTESLKQFALKRFFRIYPPFWASIIFLVMSFYLLRLFNIQTYGFSDPKSLANILLNASLFNFLTEADGLISGVAWTLMVELLFYCWIAILFPVLFKKPVLALLITFGIISTLLYSLFFVSYFGLLITFGKFISFMFLGTILYLRGAGLINEWVVYAFSAFFWLLFLTGIHVLHGDNIPDFSLAQYSISYGLAYFIFCLALFFENKIKLESGLKHLSDISYSLYIFHGGIGLITIKSLYPLIGFTWALLIALALIVMFCTLTHRFIEVPSQRLARLLLRKNNGAPLL